MKNELLLLSVASLLSAACGGDDQIRAGGAPTGANPPGASTGVETFTVTVENVAPIKPFTSSGVFNMPVGDTSAGPATPGKRYEFTVNAGRKQKLSFATMLAATNDLFFGPDGNGIALYDANGEPLSGDVTEQIHLWDAGTEINEEPAVGPNTVTHQVGPNTGPDEGGNIVDIANATDGVPFAYPAVADVLRATVTHRVGTEFLVTIENVSSDTALQTSEGDLPAPLSPGVWVVHNGSDPLYTVGMPDRGQGIENIAEDGDPMLLGAFAAANSGITFPASPGVWAIHLVGDKPLYTEGSPDRGDGIEGIAEDGNPATLGANASGLDGVLADAIFNTPVGAAAPGPIMPGSKYEFSFDASPGDALSLASMLAATNDVFFGAKDTGIELFDADAVALSGDITRQIYLWDAGTEANEEPGIGPNTVTNQLAPNTGDPGENRVQRIADVDDGFVYPAVESLLRVTVAVK
jgi:hypothetical protein